MKLAGFTAYLLIASHLAKTRLSVQQPMYALGLVRVEGLESEVLIHTVASTVRATL